ncbi:MAG: acyloxyacyl hydrolase [Bacteroidales bacterium]|nr:acyloxyacyl hydrolase [Bacteroidales bacterium]
MNYIRYLGVSLLLLVLQHHVTFGIQDTASVAPRKVFFSVHAQQGSLLKTHKTDIVANYYVGLDLRIGWQTDDFQKNIFDRSYRYPYYGIGYYMGNMNGIVLGNDEQSGFGRPAALYAFFGAPIYRGKWFQVKYDISAGISYNFNSYDPQVNPYNILVGSKNNAYINFGFESVFSLPGHSSLGLGFSLQHFSNGSYQKPNKGINLVSSTVSYQFGLYKNRDKKYSRFPVPSHEPTLEWYLFIASGVRMLDTDFDPDKPRQGHRWYCANVSSATLIKINHRRKFGAGLDLFYFDWGRYVIGYRAHENGETVTTKRSDNFALGAFLAHEVGYKRVWLVTNLGFYLNQRVGDDPKKPWIYERIGVKFQLTSRLFVGVSVKAHMAKADYTEWTVGYSLIKDRPLKRLPRNGN